MPSRARPLFFMLFALVACACASETDPDETDAEDIPVSADEQEMVGKTCKDLRCGGGKRCVLDRVKCKKAPCPAIPRCK